MQLIHLHEAEATSHISSIHDPRSVKWNDKNQRDNMYNFLVSSAPHNIAQFQLTVRMPPSARDWHLCKNQSSSADRARKNYSLALLQTCWPWNCLTRPHLTLTAHKMYSAGDSAPDRLLPLLRAWAGYNRSFSSAGERSTCEHQLPFDSHKPRSQLYNLSLFRLVSDAQNKPAHLELFFACVNVQSSDKAYPVSTWSARGVWRYACVEVRPGIGAQCEVRRPWERNFV